MRRLNTNIFNAVNSHENLITVNFKFNGKRYKGHKGESLASALIANDIAIVGRSFKFSRPRVLLVIGQKSLMPLFKLVLVLVQYQI
ncbi:MAG: hypothetical protein CM15mP51_15210 [Porticoccaceae bacterium]|nr:MAG: hypothetical protein CM15mP51_15210 [Porticoccaceae bacterium]